MVYLLFSFMSTMTPSVALSNTACYKKKYSVSWLLNTIALRCVWSLNPANVAGRAKKLNINLFIIIVHSSCYMWKTILGGIAPEELYQTHIQSNFFRK